MARTGRRPVTANYHHNGTTVTFNVAGGFGPGLEAIQAAVPKNVTIAEDDASGYKITARNSTDALRAFDALALHFGWATRHFS